MPTTETAEEVRSATKPAAAVCPPVASRSSPTPTHPRMAPAPVAWRTGPPRGEEWRSWPTSPVWSWARPPGTSVPMGAGTPTPRSPASETGPPRED